MKNEKEIQVSTVSTTVAGKKAYIKPEMKAQEPLERATTTVYYYYL